MGDGIEQMERGSILFIYVTEREKRKPRKEAGMRGFLCDVMGRYAVCACT